MNDTGKRELVHEARLRCCFQDRCFIFFLHVVLFKFMYLNALHFSRAATRATTVSGIENTLSLKNEIKTNTHKAHGNL